MIDGRGPAKAQTQTSYKLKAPDDDVYVATSWKRLFSMIYNELLLGFSVSRSKR